MCRQSGKASSEPPDLVPQTGTYNLYWQYTSWKKRRKDPFFANENPFNIQEAMMILLIMLIVKFLEALVKGTGIVMGAYK